MVFFFFFDSWTWYIMELVESIEWEYGDGFADFYALFRSKLFVLDCLVSLTKLYF